MATFVRSKIISLLALAMISSTCFAELTYKPYFGAEFQYNPVRFSTDELGVAKFKNWTPQERLFVGVQVNEYFASEFGYEFSDKTTKRVTIHDGDLFFGRIVPPVDNNDTHQLEFKSRAWSLNFIGIYPHLPHNLSILGSAGFSRMNVTAYDMLIGVNGDFTQTWQRASLNAKTRTIPSIGAGIQWTPSQRFSFRFMSMWQNKSKFDSLTGRIIGDNISATLKNNIKFNAGILFYI